MEQEEQEGIEESVGINIKWLVEQSELRNVCWMGKDMGLKRVEVKEKGKWNRHV